MRPSALLLTIGLCLACGGEPVDRLLWPGQWRNTSPDERSYLYLAWDLRSPVPCERISPRALTFIQSAPVSMRSRCFTGLAANLRDPAWCERVESVRTLLRNGARFSRQRCLERVADPRGTLAGGIDDPARLLRELGFDRAALLEQCRLAAERGAEWAPRLADSVERCVGDGADPPACRAHALRLASSLYFRDGDAPCTSFYAIDAIELGPVAITGDPEPDWPRWYRTKLRSGELHRRVERLPDLRAR